MKNLKDYITESQNFLVNKKLKNRQDKYEYHPTSPWELQDIIIDLLKKGITDLNCIDVSNITNLDWIFYRINKKVPVKEIDISEWNVSKVTTMCSTFCDCEEFNADLSKWDVSNVKEAVGMFARCKKFNSDLSKWQTGNMEFMNSMFTECGEFNSDLSNWDTHNVIYMNVMFFWCKKFDSDLSKWDVSKVKEMKNIFDGCDTLKQNNKIPAWFA